MRRRFAVLLGGLALSLAAGCGGTGEELPALPPGSFAAASGSFASDTHLFGDIVTAQADVVVDRTRLQPARVRFETDFKPYEQIGETEVERRDAGDLTELRYRFRLRCLEYDCLSAIGTIVDPGAGAPRSYRFPPGQLLYQDAGAKQARLLRTVRWPQLQAASRINGQDVSQVYGFPFRSHVTPLPRLTYRITPSGLAALALALALALLALPATLIVRRIRSRQPPPEEPEPELSPLQQALLLVEWSRGRENGAERREALEALAVELEALESDGLADETRRAAWSPAAPSPEDAGRIVSIVKETHGDA